MTPSEAHDSARNRDAGHDELQAAVWRYYNGNPYPNGIFLKIKSYGNGEIYRPQKAYVEFPFLAKSAGRYSHSSRVAGFADVLLKLATVEMDELPKEREWRLNSRKAFTSDWAYIAFEIKPVIYSVGSVIRQCKALHHIANLGEIPCPTVVPVVYATDPKISLLKELMPETVAWDGDRPV
jgi:hypothetical protein